MQIKVCEKLKVYNPADYIKKYCREYLTIDNPEFYKRESMGKWTGNLPRTISLYENVGGELWLPFGCVRDIWKLCKEQNDSDVQWDVCISPIQTLNYVSNINLYSYQENAVEKAIKAKNGILVMPCGSGKTQSGLEIIARLGGKALWLTHTQDLLNQSKKRAESILSNAGFGTITSGKINIGTHITFATVQTMCKLDLSSYKDYWDIIIVDECQHCCGSPTRVTQFYKVVSQLCARYKIGLTATPKRADGLERGMFSLLGSIIYEVDKKDVKDYTCPVRVSVIPTGWMPDYDCVLMGDGTIDYAKVVDNMIHDDNRFYFIADYIAKLKGRTIVLANRVEYLQRLCDDYNKWQVGNAICISGAGQSKSAKEERKKALSALESGEIDCIFATYQLAKEGLDVPHLEYVVFATPEKDETTIIQSVGRVGRKADGKEFGTVIDFVDNFGMYKGWANKRKAYYKKINVEIC